MAMIVPVMWIGVVGMPVHLPDMLVPMRVWLTGRIDLSVLMLVMSIVTMPVFVFHRLVEAIMPQLTDTLRIAKIFPRQSGGCFEPTIMTASVLMGDGPKTIL